MEEPVKETDLWPLVFDELKPKPQTPEYSPEAWEAEQKRLEEKFKTLNNGQ